MNKFFNFCSSFDWLLKILRRLKTECETVCKQSVWTAIDIIKRQLIKIFIIILLMKRTSFYILIIVVIVCSEELRVKIEKCSPLRLRCDAIPHWCERENNREKDSDHELNAMFDWLSRDNCQLNCQIRFCFLEFNTTRVIQLDLLSIEEWRVKGDTAQAIWAHKSITSHHKPSPYRQVCS